MKENEQPPAELSFKGPAFNSKASITLLANGKKLNWKKEDDRIKIFLPKEMKDKHAIVIKIQLQ